jgi:hypothetical protein
VVLDGSLDGDGQAVLAGNKKSNSAPNRAQNVSSFCLTSDDMDGFGLHKNKKEASHFLVMSVCSQYKMRRMEDDRQQRTGYDYNCRRAGWNSKSRSDCHFASD